MAKTDFLKRIKKSPQGELIAFCDQRDLDHTGNREALIAKLVAYEEAKATEPEPEPVAEVVAEEKAPEVEVEVTPPPEPES